MPQFKYTARNSEGKLVEGVITSNDRGGAILQIEQQRCFPIKISPVAESTGSTASSKGNAKTTRTAVTSLSYSHQFLFTEQLAHLLAAGMTLDEALGILEKRLKQPKLQTISQSLHRALVDGRSLSQALRDYPKVFSSLYVNMVAAGEASGTLSKILHRLTSYLADIKSLRDRVQQALVYPAVLVVAGFGLILVFMTAMVPKLLEFFQQTGQKMPPATQALLSINRIISHYWWAGVLLVVGVVLLQKLFTRSSDGRKAWDAMMLKLPGYGHVIRYRFYAQFARTLSTLVENGITLLRALELLEDISGNEWIRQHLVATRTAVVDGAPLSAALRQQGIFPEMFLDMMAVGEQTGRFGDTMQMIAEMYERELDKQVKIISTLIPPVIMIFIASIVGLVVYGILSAVFGLTSGLRAQMH